MAWLDPLLLWWHRRKTRAKMQRVFSRRPDPFSYDSGSAYEAQRLAAMETALGGRRHQHALEIGCAEGAFTERLAKHAERLTSVDISAVALSRARKRLESAGNVDFVESDVRDWSPPPGRRYGLIVLGDVLYYIDKPMVRAIFEGVFPRVASWLEPGANLVLAHGFAGPQELAHRRGFRERFENQGLKLVSESVAGPDSGTVQCLISVLVSVEPK
jgi:cyclopropane fatty-acyl-phospholipid synthase-like methyltransferase